MRQLHSNGYLCPNLGSYFTKYPFLGDYLLKKYVNKTRKEIKYSGQEEIESKT